MAKIDPSMPTGTRAQSSGTYSLIVMMPSKMKDKLRVAAKRRKESMNIIARRAIAKELGYDLEDGDDFLQ